MMQATINKLTIQYPELKGKVSIIQDCISINTQGLQDQTSIDILQKEIGLMLHEDAMIIAHYYQLLYKKNKIKGN